jgi:hypothetical protein
LQFCFPFLESVSFFAGRVEVADSEFYLLSSRSKFLVEKRKLPLKGPLNWSIRSTRVLCRVLTIKNARIITVFV